MEESNPELEAFRRKWKEEVSARTQDASKPSSSKGPRRPPPIPRTSTRRLSKPPEEEDEHIEPQRFSNVDATRSLESGYGESSKVTIQEPESALEHYEKAVERESEGSLGDSLNLYRKAFRMDHRVDQKYKNKHFPPSYFKSKPTNPNPSNAAVTVPNTAHHSLDGPPQLIKQLIAGFSGLSIEPVPPPVEGAPAPPCPLAELPDEILIHILKDVAILDDASFTRLGQVCKRMAYLVLTEEQIWKRICVGSEVGFATMHYEWQQEVLGGPLLEDHILEPQDDSEDEEGLAPNPLGKEEVTESLLTSAYSSSWQQMFRLRPRIRFNGCYISTVNYFRPGQGSQSSVTWHNPVHIVTYYRYLRFFRDGTVISLLTTEEPTDVVHHLTKDLLETHRGGNVAYLPSIVMQHALRGRWRLSSSADSPDADLKDAEGDVFVETEGVKYPKYLYRMKFSLRSAGRAARNNKLAWAGFWSYNTLTDDTAEFTLKNDKAFFFSRVKSYGAGA
ncbi:F-box protein HRT3 [Lachnellula suecica]|uniref:F-box protein HRT3 n=1 Tax=Lachnellula suecica TaxID=602035 RepID=A0A8T9C0T3_9HELO|nr:F-box protein HRT3 [Lachnellula suecica]